MAHIEELRPQYRGSVDRRPSAHADGLDWTALVVPVAVVSTLAWIGLLVWAAVHVIEIALA